MRHVSDALHEKLSDLPKDKRSRVLDVANADTDSTSIKGANRDVSVRDWATKVRPHRRGQIHAPEMPASSGKPKADWPAPTHGTFSSGMARAGKLGTMPSKDTPSR
jgi:hypothetical protein